MNSIGSAHADRFGIPQDFAREHSDRILFNIGSHSTLPRAARTSTNVQQIVGLSVGGAGGRVTGGLHSIGLSEEGILHKKSCPESSTPLGAYRCGRRFSIPVA